MYIYESNYLAHHGILGMKWGVRRFQNPDGSLTNAGQRRYDKEVAKINKAKGRIQKLKPNTKPETEDEFNARKERILKSGTAKQVASLRGKLTNDELATVKRRLELERDVASLVPKERSAMEKATSFFSKVSDISEMIAKGEKAFSTVKDLIGMYSKEGRAREEQKQAFKNAYINLGKSYMERLSKMSAEDREAAAKDMTNADKIWRSAMGQNISKKDK